MTEYILLIIAVILLILAAALGGRVVLDSLVRLVRALRGIPDGKSDPKDEDIRFYRDEGIRRLPGPEYSDDCDDIEPKPVKRRPQKSGGRSRTVKVNKKRRK